MSRNKATEATESIDARESAEGHINWETLNRPRVKGECEKRKKMKIWRNSKIIKQDGIIVNIL